jgi:hypothetical protein
MSDDTNQNDVEPPEEDEMFAEDQPPEVDQETQEALQQAHQFHAGFDQAKEWATETAADLRVKAALEDDPEVAEQVEQIAKLVRSVNRRISQGDNNMARQP